MANVSIWCDDCNQLVPHMNWYWHVRGFRHLWNASIAWSQCAMDNICGSARPADIDEHVGVHVPMGDTVENELGPAHAVSDVVDVGGPNDLEPASSDDSSDDAGDPE